MARKKIDLSDIKKNDIDETSSFTDLMTKKERSKRNSEDIDDMISEKRKSSELEEKFEEAKNEYKKSIKEELEDTLGKTQILELTRQMKFNFEEKKEENKKKRKHGISPLNIVGELNLFCIGYYIYLLAFTNYQDIESRYMLNGGIIILLTLLFGLSVVTGKKVSKFFYIINIITIFGFIFYNTYTLVA
jgi:predicted RNase H-like nuclease (RuvC/YqgF family)